MNKRAFAVVGMLIAAACSSSKGSGTSSSTGNPTGTSTSAGNSSSTGIGNGGSTISSSTSMSTGGGTVSSSTGFGGGTVSSSSTGMGTGGGSAVSSSSGGTGGCGTFSTLKYTFTLASGFDWSKLQVALNATAYMDDGTTQDQPEGAFLTSTSPTYSFSEFGCVPKVDVSYEYTNAANAGFFTDCTATGTLKETTITIQPPTNTDQATCTAPTPQ